MGGEGKVTQAMSEALARDFGSVQRWRTQFSALGYALGGGSGWDAPDREAYSAERRSRYKVVIGCR